MTNSNVYVQQIAEQGKELSHASASKKTFPCTIGWKTFDSQEEYDEALADFINGN